MLKAYVHSTESCGTVDGPGIRFITFFQGCVLRCLYCHNRDCWKLNEGREVTVQELMNELRPYRSFMDASGGGITASGGEALLQPEFIRDYFRACKEEGIHTCLDTSGYVRRYDEVLDDLMAETDLVMLDLKQVDDEKHRILVGVPNKKMLDFAMYLNKIGKKTWIRHVVVPGYSDDEHSARQLGEFIQNMDNIEQIELLPYHELGKHKWTELGEKYALDNVKPPSKETMESLKATLSEYHSNVVF